MSMESITLRDWVDKIHQEDIVKVLHGGVLPKLLELAALQDWFVTMYGVELEVYVKPAEVKDSKFFSKEAVEKLRP